MGTTRRIKIDSHCHMVQHYIANTAHLHQWVRLMKGCSPEHDQMLLSLTPAPSWASSIDTDTRDLTPEWHGDTRRDPSRPENEHRHGNNEVAGVYPCLRRHNAMVDGAVISTPCWATAVKGCAVGRVEHNHTWSMPLTRYYRCGVRSQSLFICLLTEHRVDVTFTCC